MNMKVAISVPDPVFEAAERLAKQRAVPRSQLFTEPLQDYLAKHGSAAITDQLNAVYAERNGVRDNFRLFGALVLTSK